MVRQKQNNAFTMVECLLVLLIITIFTLAIPNITFKDSSDITMKDIVDLCVYTQEKAFLYKRDAYIEFNTHSIQFDDYHYSLPSNMVCDVASLYFNEKGNINQAKTVRCNNGRVYYKLIFQLGSGRVRYEKE